MFVHTCVAQSACKCMPLGEEGGGGGGGDHVFEDVPPWSLYTLYSPNYLHAMWELQ